MSLRPAKRTKTSGPGAGGAAATVACGLCENTRGDTVACTECEFVTCTLCLVNRLRGSMSSPLVCKSCGHPPLLQPLLSLNTLPLICVPMHTLLLSALLARHAPLVSLYDSWDDRETFFRHYNEMYQPRQRQNALYARYRRELEDLFARMLAHVYRQSFARDRYDKDRKGHVRTLVCFEKLLRGLPEDAGPSERLGDIVGRVHSFRLGAGGKWDIVCGYDEQFAKNVSSVTFTGNMV
ncbi:hypothetical protein SARC_00087 [Sphaeroforma arctica JP610]|uniref:Uncharacterized protein n=1 Tax=Sphaeroforma arctica JP610 TaxID=667725 RepID=A0A0L0GFH5_9EUKA|nr:hypothetical protein SARC_00087 [Sphaeroforma arctica JP610]KNC87830.1 hypothetical protein SARC_00087 [Sphaeroforma arctica JP610]|eukprot:XP_014161732.1 hypothetical protein SARC_00087 [Sphaeroforma arctica JP610]